MLFLNNAKGEVTVYYEIDGGVGGGGRKRGTRKKSVGILTSVFEDRKIITMFILLTNITGTIWTHVE